MEFQIVIANNVDSLSAVNPTHTVEAEFGKYCANGSETTLAHHGPRSSNPVPCLGNNIPSKTEDLVIGVSHFDLDCLGGVMRCLGKKNFDYGEEDLFWQVAALVDLKGVHKLEEIREEFFARKSEGIKSPSGQEDCWHYCQQKWNEVLTKLHAFWAWQEDHDMFPPRLVKPEDQEFTPGLMDPSNLTDPNLVDVTTFFTEAIQVVSIILEGTESDPERVVLLHKGQEWFKAMETLEIESFHGFFGEDRVILRASAQFTNHLYSHGSTVTNAVVAFNEKDKSVTLSLADPISGVNCEQVAQALWGPEAGGKLVIAGSPRGQKMTMHDADLAAHKLSLAIRDHS